MGQARKLGVVRGWLLALTPLSFLLLLAAALGAGLDGAHLPAEIRWNGGHWQVASHSGALKAGDEILEIYGRPVTFATLLGDPVQLRSRQELGHYLREKTVLYPALKSARLHIQVLRHGRVLPLEVTPARYSWTQWVGQAWVELLPACVFLWAGWTTLARAPDRRPSFWFCLMCLLTACCYLASVPFRHGAFLQPQLLLLFLGVNLVSFVAGPAVLLHVTLLLPEPRVSHGFLALLYSLVVIVLLSWEVPVLVAVVGTLYAAVLLAVVQATWRYSASVHRQQMKWVWLGYALGLLPGLLFNGLPLLLGRPRLLEDYQVGFCLIFIPWFYALAIQRYRLFDIATLAEGSLVYAFTVAVLYLLEVGLLAGLGGGFSLSTPALLTVAIFASLFGGVYRRIARRLGPRPPDVLRSFQTRARGKAPAEVLQALEATLREWPAPHSMQWIAARRRPGCQLLLGEPLCLEIHLEAPRALVLGPARQPYSTGTLRVLEQLAHQAALLYQNAQLFETEGARRQKALEERERLLNDLHDGVGASLAGIRMLSQEPAVAALAGDALFELQHFLYDGTDHTFSSQQLVAELRSLGNRLLEPAHIDFRLQAETTGVPLERCLALALFRFYRDSLSELRQTPGVRSVLVGFAVSPTRILLNIQDDGPNGDRQAPVLNPRLQRSEATVQAGERRLELEIRLRDSPPQA